MYGDKLSVTEDGGHVRWGYTHEEIEKMFKQCGLEAIKKDFIGGMVSQQITNILRFVGKKINRRFAWTATIPLRPLSLLDPALSKILQYPFHSIGIIGIKK